MNVALLVGLAFAIVVIVFLAVQVSSKKRAATAAAERASSADARAASLENAVDTYKASLARVEQVAAQAQETAARLSRFQGVADADLEAGRLLATAQADARAILEAAEAQGATFTKRSRDEAETQLSAARDAKAAASAALTDAASKAKLVLESASSDAAKIISDANAKAVQIAGDALEAKNEASALQRTVRAIKNTIEGYGDAYIVPTESLLDDLAEEFGFSEAGQRLKAARELTKEMVVKKTAADCDYAESNRKETAIDFVLDAFNGKVDTILAKTKADNFGTLEQKIRDAFELVNHHGRAFRNARIAEPYLKTRLEELRWGVIATELRDREREEQRALKERIREEERAQKEYEKAIKDAAKEEDLLLKAMDKARSEIAKAKDADKAKYEAQLQELAAKLRVAEAKNQKALSMAQQTRAGHVYVISNEGSFGGNVYKIGLTRRLEPLDRIRELGDASVPFEFDVHALIPSDDAPALEHELHKKFVKLQMNKVNPRKEFFRVSLGEIRAVVESSGYAAHWTMTATCREFKESLALERAIKEGAVNEKEWEARQISEHDAALRLPQSGDDEKAA